MMHRTMQDTLGCYSTCTVTWAVLSTLDRSLSYHDVSMDHQGPVESSPDTYHGQCQIFLLCALYTLDSVDSLPTIPVVSYPD